MDWNDWDEATLLILLLGCLAKKKRRGQEQKEAPSCLIHLASALRLISAWKLWSVRSIPTTYYYAFPALRFFFTHSVLLLLYYRTNRAADGP